MVLFQEFEGSSDVLQLLLKQAQASSSIPEASPSVPTDQPRKKSLTSREIANNCFAFLLAGYETTSTALAFSAWLLAKNQEKQEILQQEIDQYLGAQVRTIFLLYTFSRFFSVKVPGKFCNSKYCF
jgi:cytochrome P450